MKAKTKRSGNPGFTLIEILTVVCIITLLIGLTANAAFSARQKANKAAATTEAEQVSAAFKAYQIRHHEWPVSQAGAWVPLTRKNLAKLIGDANDPAGNKTVLLDIPDSRFETGLDHNGSPVSDAYCDPWGNVYEVWINKADETDDKNKGEAGTMTSVDAFEFVVSFPMQFARHADWNVPYVDENLQ